MTSVLFEARLTNATQGSVISFSCILFGPDSVEQKEKLFRAMCQSKYPYWQIEEPLTVRIMELLRPPSIYDYSKLC
ncbi:MAG: hypothetical protein EOO61_19105 [Hymenobacter sp.]|nr:MAG: hypothetical protein EOO61_19105 [Hymenobacter sp.]